MVTPETEQGRISVKNMEILLIMLGEFHKMHLMYFFMPISKMHFNYLYWQ